MYMNTINQLQQANPEFGSSKKLPRYIYHMTSKAHYESMLNDGFIKLSENKLHVDKGVYAFDLCNFFKHWKKHKDWGYDDLQRAILRHVVHWFQSASSGKGDLVILKIPTSKLDSNKLFVRSINRLFKFEDSQENFNKLSTSQKKHLRGETPANEAILYKRRKEAIEYIYKDNIPLENVQQIGNIVNIAALRKNSKFGINPVKFIMQSLLEGTSEAKGAELIKNNS